MHLASIPRWLSTPQQRRTKHRCLAAVARSLSVPARPALALYAPPALYLYAHSLLLMLAFTSCGCCCCWCHGAGGESLKPQSCIVTSQETASEQGHDRLTGRKRRVTQPHHTDNQQPSNPFHSTAGAQLWTSVTL